MIYILFSPFLYLRNNYKKKSFHHLLIIKNKNKKYFYLSMNFFSLKK